ncbi:uncharacterized protein LOC105634305 [Jatropha curcas]|uniref:uncharacterized protein LOC105634305 n=1 Tax=Jatropha curcas TaxID=180498 RepID=UPI0005FBF826|nr:uncharacterized protein LOC105634305 [Jatropha curcas]
MAITYTQFLMLLLSACAVGTTAATGSYRDWGSNSPHYKRSHKEIIVGGSANWSFGFNYSDWAFKNNPFFLKDTLVFKYDRPVENKTRPHNVWLLPDLQSLSTCNFSKGVKIANETEGAGEGFKFVLKEFKPYYFACGIGDGIHCNIGNMRFLVVPAISDD